jgi:hypothetical protein
MKKIILYYVAIAVVLFLFAGFLTGFLPNASAVCCFPYNMNYYIDPITGDLVLNGELQNDSYKREPFGNTEYRFAFLDKDNNQILERSILLTDRLPVVGGAVIPFLVTFPFQVVLEDVDEETIQQIDSFHMDGTETLDYFSRKPADLVVSSNELVNIGSISGKNGDVFNKWQINGNVTNTHSQKTQNVYVVASLRNENDNIVGVAGYSNDSTQPVTLDGFETKNFIINALVPASEMPSSVILYTESDESSMIHQRYKPVIMRDATDHEDRRSSDPKKPILISANITNISRNDLDFEWIIQIKKSPKGISEGDISEYPDSKVAFIETIPGNVGAQKSTIMEYQWAPQSNGIYFYRMYVWDDSRAKALSYPFMQSFLDDNWLIVSSNLNSVTNQIKSGIPLDEIQCVQGLELAHKSSNGNLVCVKPETKKKLIERGWAIEDSQISETSSSWYSASDWNSFELVRNNDGLYCKSANNKLTDHCYSLEEIVFGNHHKKGQQGWKIYPGGAGWRLPENSTLTPIYKEVKFGMMPLDFAAMLDDVVFVNKCESNGGTWNYTYHDCEGLLQICEAVEGVYVRDILLAQMGCVFPYEN